MSPASTRFDAAGRRGRRPPLLLGGGVATLLCMLAALFVLAARIANRPPSEALSSVRASAAAESHEAAEPAAPSREPVVRRPSPPRPLRGPARVIDTGLLQLAGRTVRLKGVEGASGALARDMEAWIAGRPVACAPAAAGRYNCAVDGWDLAEVALFNGGGWATADASAALRRAEREARIARRGVWADG